MKRVGLYRAFQKTCIEPFVLPRFFSQSRQNEGTRIERFSFTLPEKGITRVWLHAASVGELELLWTAAMEWGAQGAEIVLTVFSESARSHVERLSETLKKAGTRVLFAGYCPWEGHWKKILSRVKPRFFVTARYEAWPDLWMSLAETGTPLVIVGARARKSLRVAKWSCRLMGGELPELLFLTASDSDSQELAVDFPEAKTVVVGESRWDRVHARLAQTHPRVQELAEKFRHRPRPWGVLAQAWPEDIEFLESLFESAVGTLWLVPHRVDDEHLLLLEESLREVGRSITKTTDPEQDTDPAKVILVNEAGFLAEFYSLMDWAYVGGGWGAGVHSTIEPALQGIAMGCGPKGAEKFPEIAELEKSGQLKVLKTSESLEAWIQSLFSRSSDRKTQWQEQARNRLGATKRIVAAVNETVLLSRHGKSDS